MPIGRLFMVGVVLLVLTISCIPVLGQDIAPPMFSHDGGVLPIETPVTLTQESDEQILYTLDGSIPVPDNADDYISPLVWEGSIRVRAMARNETTQATSAVEGRAFMQLSTDLDSFNSNLPILIINYFDVPIDDGERTPAYITVIPTGPDGRAWLTDEAELHSRIAINTRGHSSASFPKKQFGLELVHEDGENRNEPMLGMPAENNWILNGPYSDKSLIRNALSYDIGRSTGRYAPRTRFVELFLHGGNGPLESTHYHGLYVLTERIKWDNNRVNITKITPEDNEMPAISGGYIFKRDRENEGETVITTDRGASFAHVRPREPDITPQQRSWLIGYLDSLETALFGEDFDQTNIGYRKFLEPYSFIDVHLVTELMKEVDGFRLSTFLVKDREDVVQMGPLWDFNLSMGNMDFNPEPEFPGTSDHDAWEPEGWYHEHISEPLYLSGWYTRLFEDSTFRHAYRERWWQLRRGPFSDDTLVARIAQHHDALVEAQERNFERWPILGIQIWPNYFVAETHSEEIEWITDWLMTRTEWIDNELGLPVALIHYWHFNNLAGGMVSSVGADYPDASASITYTGGGEGYMDWVEEGSMMNADIGEQAGKALRVRNPSVERTLELHTPSTGFRNVVLSYAVNRTTNGARKQTIEYRVSDNDTWQMIGDTVHVFESFRQVRVDLSSIDETDDRSELRFRILFHGPETTAEQGNNRFDNITLMGQAIPVGIAERDASTDSGISAYYHSETLFFDHQEELPVTLHVMTVTGQHIATFQTVGKGMKQFPLRVSSGIYVLRAHTSGGIRATRFPVMD